MVLTQLPKTLLRTLDIRSFHTTMVLTQPVDLTFSGQGAICFHTTMVLTQPRTRLCDICGDLVSIPLWFLRNREEVSSEEAEDNGFHTTMVLTQR